MTDVRELGDENFVSLTTFRRTGAPVATPVWVVRDGDRSAVWTVRSSGKVNRLRNNPAVTAAEVRSERRDG